MKLPGSGDMPVGVGSASARQATKRVTGKAQPSMAREVAGGEEELEVKLKLDEGSIGGRRRRR
jgi:hypothetical protein